MKVAKKEAKHAKRVGRGMASDTGKPGRGHKGQSQEQVAKYR